MSYQVVHTMWPHLCVYMCVCTLCVKENSQERDTEMVISQDYGYK